jgi:hypothetical protein
MFVENLEDRGGGLLGNSKCVISSDQTTMTAGANQTQFLGSSEACNCAWSEVTHDLNACRHLHKDMIEEPNYSIWARSMPDEVKMIFLVKLNLNEPDCLLRI